MINCNFLKMRTFPFKLKNIICVVHDTFQTGSKHYLSLSVHQHTKFSQNNIISCSFLWNHKKA